MTVNIEHNVYMGFENIGGFVGINPSNEIDRPDVLKRMKELGLDTIFNQEGGWKEKKSSKKFVNF